MIEIGSDYLVIFTKVTKTFVLESEQFATIQE